MQRAFLLAVAILASMAGYARAAVPAATVSATASSSPLHAGDREAVAVVIDVPAGYHAQSHTPLEEGLIALTVTVQPAAGIDVEAPVYPAAKIEEYKLLGKVSVYTGQVVVYVPLRVAKSASGPVTIQGGVMLQLCDDKSCFPPPRKPIPFMIHTTVAEEGSFKSALDTPAFDGFDRSLLKSRSIESAIVPATRAVVTAPDGDSLAPQTLLGAVAIALVVGVIFNVMPCVLPVLPLKAVGFYEAAQHDRRRTITFGLLFAAGMIAMFLLLACVVLLSKKFLGHQFQWGQQFSYPAFVWTMAAILTVLGVGMLGVFAVRLPTSVYGLNFRHDTLIGNFLWGGLTAILSTPCTAPLFPPLLAWAIGQPRLSGFIVMTSVGVGMALPYVILSAFPQLARKFPRTGPFAELFKQMMGFLLLGTAAWFVGIRLVGDPKQWWLVFSVVVIAGAYLIYRTRQILPSPTAISIATAIAFLLIATGFAAAQKLTNVPRGWTAFTPEAFESATHADRIVLVEFSASWCLNCKYIEQTVYHDADVLAALDERKVVTIKADLTDHSAPGWELLNKLGGTGIPFTAIYPRGGGTPIILESIYTSDTLLESLKQAQASEANTR